MLIGVARNVRHDGLKGLHCSAEERVEVPWSATIRFHREKHEPTYVLSMQCREFAIQAPLTRLTIRSGRFDGSSVRKSDRGISVFGTSDKPESDEPSPHRIFHVMKSANSLKIQGWLRRSPLIRSPSAPHKRIISMV